MKQKFQSNYELISYKNCGSHFPILTFPMIEIIQFFNSYLMLIMIFWCNENYHINKNEKKNVCLLISSVKVLNNLVSSIDFGITINSILSSYLLSTLFCEFPDGVRLCYRWLNGATERNSQPSPQHAPAYKFSCEPSPCVLRLWKIVWSMWSRQKMEDQDSTTSF